MTQLFWFLSVLGRLRRFDLHKEVLRIDFVPDCHVNGTNLNKGMNDVLIIVVAIHRERARVFLHQLGLHTKAAPEDFRCKGERISELSNILVLFETIPSVVHAKNVTNIRVNKILKKYRKS